MVHKPTLYQILRKTGKVKTWDEALLLLKRNQILVNDNIMTRLDYQCNSKKDAIVVDGVLLKAPVEKVYLMLHKPVGYVTSTERDREKKHVMEIIQESVQRSASRKMDERVFNSLFPVGRLDYNSSGLLLITNDGVFARFILDPKKEVEKEYIIEIDGALNKEQQAKVREGFEIRVREEKYITKAAQIKFLKSDHGRTTYSLTLIEGKRRQIREMMKVFGYPVLALKRIRIGNLRLGNLHVGKYEEFDPDILFG